MPRNNSMKRLSTPAGRRVPVLSGALVLLLILGSCSGEEKPYAPEDITILNRWLDSHSGAPARLTSDELRAGRSVVFLQDNVLRADSISMLQGLLPSLYDAGVRSLGVFFLESSAQEDIDAFLTAPADTLPENLIKDADARLGYAEYCDFMKYVRDFNSRLPEDRIRIIGLGSEGRLDSAAAGNLLVPDSAEGVDEEPGISLLPSGPVFLWIPADERNRLPESDAVMLTHRIPGDGLIDDALAGRVMRDRSFSYAAAEEPFAAWDLSGTAEKSDIVIVTPFVRSAVTPIDDFITLDDLDHARAFFPDTGNDNMPGAQVAAMNRAIKRAARGYAKSLD